MEQEDEDITEDNVDKYVLKAIKKYFDMNMVVDGMFWRHIFVLLQKKYEFELEAEAKLQ